MKKTHWLRNTLIVLIICGLIGTILTVILFNSDGNRTYASATIQFSFNGAAEGKAPNGYPFDVSGLTTDTAEQLRDNLTVAGAYPEKIVEQMTKYVSLLDTNADSQAAVTDYRATQYAVTLYNDFDKSISASQLKELLNQILTAYRTYFAKTCTASLETEEDIADLQEYDYAQQLEEISGSNERLIRYAKEVAELAPEFRVNKKGFGDIATRYEGLKSDIDRLDATVTFDAVSKDQGRLQKRYETEIRTQQYQLESLTEELKRVEEQVNAYDKDGIIYVSANGTLQQVGSDENGTYDKLVEKRKDLTDQISGINAKIALYQSRLNDMNGAVTKQAGEDEEDAAAAEPMTEAEKQALQADVEKKIEALRAKKDAVTADFAAMLDAYTAQQINENTVAATAARYSVPSILSGAFIVKAVKTAGPICAVGFIVCMVLLIISRRKEEKYKMKNKEQQTA